MARGRNTLLPSVSIYDTAKGASFTNVLLMDSEIGDFRIKNYSSNAFLQAPDFSPKPLANIAIFL